MIIVWHVQGLTHQRRHPSEGWDPVSSMCRGQGEYSEFGAGMCISRRFRYAPSYG